jgi:omega-6 fatty acid desaturase (delta-12 desaturase)
MWVVLVHGHWTGLLLMVPAASLVVLLFMIQYDCGHGSSFFHGRLANDWVGRAIGVVTLTTYDYWRRHHARLSRELSRDGGRILIACTGIRP